jgi:hypothetical protein
MGDKMENRKSFKALLIFISYFIYSSFQTIPLSLIGINYSTLSLSSKVIYILTYELLYIILLIFLYRKTFKDDILDYIKNFKSYIKYLDYWAIAFFLMIISNIAITYLLPSSVATNQELINELFTKAPVYIIVSSVLYAPIIEEIIFRLSLRNIFKNNLVFIIISGLVFGALHVVSSFERWSDLIYIITYSIPGFIFAYSLVKSKNICVPMSLHLFHNGFMTLLQVILIFLS